MPVKRLSKTQLDLLTKSLI